MSMYGSRLRSAAVAGLAVLTLAVSTGDVLAGSQPGDETALAPARTPAAGDVEARVDRLLRRMTLNEKLQQLQLLSDGQVTEDDARRGLGSVFSLTDPARINALQRVAVEQSR